MISLNRSATWPIRSNSTDPMCVCIPDPVGVPDVSATRRGGLANLEYLGRIKLAPIEYLGRTVEMDHYANWFFHVMMEVNESVPNYGKSPIRLASAYAGTAVYQNWVLEDPNITHPDIFLADMPTTADEHLADSGKYCLNPTFFEPCLTVKPFSDEAGPATWPPMSPGHGDQCADHPGCVNLAPGICCATDSTRMACCDDPENPVPPRKKVYVDVLKGMMKGLLSDTDDVDTCTTDGLGEVLMLAASVEDLKEGKVLDFLTDLSVALGKIQPLLSDCKVVQGEVQKLLSAIKAVTPAKAKTNAKVHRSDILEAVAGFSRAGDAKDYENMGQSVGVILRKLLEEDGVTVV